MDKILLKKIKTLAIACVLSYFLNLLPISSTSLCITHYMFYLFIYDFFVCTFISLLAMSLHVSSSPSLLSLLSLCSHPVVHPHPDSFHSMRVKASKLSLPPLLRLSTLCCPSQPAPRWMMERCKKIMEECKRLQMEVQRLREENKQIRVRRTRLNELIKTLTVKEKHYLIVSYCYLTSQSGSHQSWLDWQWWIQKVATP